MARAADLPAGRPDLRLRPDHHRLSADPFQRGGRAPAAGVRHPFGPDLSVGGVVRGQTRPEMDHGHFRRGPRPADLIDHSADREIGRADLPDQSVDLFRGAVLCPRRDLFHPGNSREAQPDRRQFPFHDHLDGLFGGRTGTGRAAGKFPGREGDVRGGGVPLFCFRGGDPAGADKI